MTIEQKALELYPVINMGNSGTPIDANKVMRDIWLAGATYALELAAQRAKVLRVGNNGQTDSGNDFYVMTPVTITVDKQSILELKTQI